MIDFKFNLSFDVPLTNQEMLDRAVRGLRSQKFERSMTSGKCSYMGPDGRHCAWGWVDPSTWSLPEYTSATRDGEVTSSSTMFDLRRAKHGLAARLSDNQYNFAVQLQDAHDGGTNPRAMVDRLRDLSEKFGLTYPEI
jgi:hypothetical protein